MSDKATDRDLEDLISAAEMSDDEYGCGCAPEPVREYVRLLEQVARRAVYAVGDPALNDALCLLNAFQHARRVAWEEADARAKEAERERVAAQIRDAAGRAKRTEFEARFGVPMGGAPIWRITSRRFVTDVAVVEQAQIPGDEENALAVWLGPDWREHYEATAERIDEVSA